MTTEVLLIALLLLFALNAPIAIAIGVASVLGILVQGDLFDGFHDSVTVIHLLRILTRHLLMLPQNANVVLLSNVPLVNPN